MTTREESEAAARRYRLNRDIAIDCIQLPSRHLCDMQTLADSFLAERAERQRRIEAAAREIYTGISYQWPADVREVERVIMRHLDGETT